MNSATGPMRRFVDAIRRNLPSRKPQLWASPGRAVRRRLALEVGSRVSPTWLDTPRVASLDGGLRMDLVTRSAIERAIFLYGVWELSATVLLNSVLRPGMTFVDVGANVGYFSLVAAAAVGERGAVHAFEPASAMADRLERNADLNGFTNVHVTRAIVTGHTGTESFYESDVPDNPGCSSILPGEGRRATGQTIAATTLDEYLARVGDPAVHLVKIDVEGAEEQVLAGCSRLLARADAPLLLFESEHIASASATLRKLGYETRVLNYSPPRREIELPTPGSRYENVFAAYEAPNFVALKPGRAAHGLPRSFDAIIEASRGRA